MVTTSSKSEDFTFYGLSLLKIIFFLFSTFTHFKPIIFKEIDWKRKMFFFSIVRFHFFIFFFLLNFPTNLKLLLYNVFFLFYLNNVFFLHSIYIQTIEMDALSTSDWNFFFSLFLYRFIEFYLYLKLINLNNKKEKKLFKSMSNIDNFLNDFFYF